MENNQLPGTTNSDNVPGAIIDTDIYYVTLATGERSYLPTSAELNRRKRLAESNRGATSRSLEALVGRGVADDDPERLGLESTLAGYDAVLADMDDVAKRRDEKLPTATKLDVFIVYPSWVDRRKAERKCSTTDPDTNLVSVNYSEAVFEIMQTHLVDASGDKVLPEALGITEGAMIELMLNRIMYPDSVGDSWYWHRPDAESEVSD